jgi:hypothetical protein
MPRRGSSLLLIITICALFIKQSNGMNDTVTTSNVTAVLATNLTTKHSYDMMLLQVLVLYQVRCHVCQHHLHRYLFCLCVPPSLVALTNNVMIVCHCHCHWLLMSIRVQLMVVIQYQLLVMVVMEQRHLQQPTLTISLYVTVDASNGFTHSLTHSTQLNSTPIITLYHLFTRPTYVCLHSWVHYLQIVHRVIPHQHIQHVSRVVRQISPHHIHHVYQPNQVLVLLLLQQHQDHIGWWPLQRDLPHIHGSLHIHLNFVANMISLFNNSIVSYLHLISYVWFWLNQQCPL